MSTEMNNPQTVGEKLDAAANLVEQMMMAHNVRDEAHFVKVHARAGKLLFEAQRQLEGAEDDGSEDDGQEVEDLEAVDFTGGAEVAYRAYAASTGGKTFDGRDMPAWDDLGVKVQTAWEASVRQTLYMFLGIEHDPEAWAGWQRPE